MTQDEALNILKQGHNAYITGPAGSGKTYLLNQYIEYLADKKVDTAVTASTGIAATHMNGVTIHSWSGMGIKEKITKHDIKDLLKRNYLRDNIMPAKVLIIDEISMLHAWQLDAVDRICRAFKKIEQPFGGIQVILSGDFFQLPPVVKNGETPQFVTESAVWQQMDLRVCYLEEQHRHVDATLSGVLNQLRRNATNAETDKVLAAREYQEVAGDIEPTKLYTHNADVDAINNMELDKIRSKKFVYHMHEKGHDKLVVMLKKGCLAPEKLELKRGAVVMFVRNNFKKGYVNGTLGKVVRFDRQNRPIVKTRSGKRIIATPTSWSIEEYGNKKAEISQIPLRLAWAITVHKSQGMSLDAAEVDLSKTFVEGMGYVALSRVRSLEGLRLMGLNELALRVDPAVIELDKALMAQSEQDKHLAGASGEEQQRLHQDFVKRSRSRLYDDEEIIEIADMVL